MDNKIIEIFLQSYEELNNLKGRSFEFSNDIIQKLNKDNFLNDISKYISEDFDDKDINVSINSIEHERYMVLYVIMNMIKDGEIELNLTDKADNKNINYINKLIESLENKQ